MDVTPKITDLFPLGKLQELQDSFSNLIKFTSVIMDKNGHLVTHPSNWDGSCKFFYSSETWSSDCHFDRLQMLTQSMRTMRTAISACPHTGFAAAIIPIVLERRFMAGWAIGQIRIEEISGYSHLESAACALSRKMNITLAEGQALVDRLPCMSIADFNRLSALIKSFGEASLSLTNLTNNAPLNTPETYYDAGGDIENSMEPPVRVYAASRKPFDLSGKCLGVLLSGTDTDSAISDVLEMVGRRLGVSRAFVFVHTEGLVYSNRYDWRGTASKLRRSPLISVDIGRNARNVFECFRRDETIIASDISKLPSGLCSVLSDLSERSIIMFPTWDESGLLGFVGVSDCRVREWTAEEITILWNLSTMITDRIRKDSIPTESGRQGHSILDMLNNTMYKIIEKINQSD
ncbi:MAG: PocR ligand-binding domain-containing protein [Synergistaceae bacterium]|jgi:ligand-binding sensor protein|nr:PocR ligand-binding domain-containing protein [Synergistaceae bacterium]